MKKNTPTLKEFLLSAKDNKSVIVVSILVGTLGGFICSRIDKAMDNTNKEIKDLKEVVKKYESQKLGSDTIGYMQSEQNIK